MNAAINNTILGVPQTELVRDVLSCDDDFVTSVEDDRLFFQLSWYAVGVESPEDRYRASWRGLHWTGLLEDKSNESTKCHEIDSHLAGVSET